MTRILKLFVVALLLCSCSKSEEAQTSQLTIKTDAGNVVYTVETAQTDDELKHGLMGRDSLPAKHGMIFDLSKHQSQLIAMWMKNTKIPLDMLFINPDGIIYWVKENAQPMSEQLIVPPAAARAVIEINGSDVEKYNIKVGQKVEHAMFDKKASEMSVSTEENLPKEPEATEKTEPSSSADAQ